MHYVYFLAGFLLAATWVSRIGAAYFGMRSISDVSKPEWNRAVPGMPRVSIIVPARNEQAKIEECITSLLNLDYPNYEIIAVDDRSTDATGEILDRIAARPEARERLRALHIEELPAGWLGKPHAMWTAVEQATGEWLLFTDADVIFKPESLRRVLGYAESDHADHVVLFPRMVMHNPGERLMIAFFQTLFVFGHRPWKVADPKAKDHMGVGAFNLIRRRAYQAIGTHRTLRLEVLDDMKLGKLVKNAGFAQRNVLGDDLISIRWAEGALGVVRNLTKNSFAIMSFEWPRAIASCFALLFLNLGPFLGVWLAHGVTRALYGVDLVAIFCVYAGMSMSSSIRPYYFFLHPISTVLFTYTMIRSMLHTLRHDGIVWRDTHYSLEELKNGMV
jgi:cellulose synthase/poly-beta-1,6-N-acetylglucosamine synthase-like glycosyltransferase